MQKRLLIRAMCLWLAGAAGLAGGFGCTPQPVYHTRGERAPARARLTDEQPGADAGVSVPAAPPGSGPRPSEPRPLHPVNLTRIDTTNAYQIGVASYYGKKFHGRQTASGAIFDMYGLTAAHRVLPLGTRIRVTNLENGRWVDLRVNDRGPFIEGRVVDLSYAAAVEVEMVTAGTARVMIEILEAVD
jgi:rare lipoprotein A (peptidoglycan hydrolase)